MVKMWSGAAVPGVSRRACLGLIPWMLIGLRAVMVPAMPVVAIAAGPAAPSALCAMLAVGLVSDILDGIVARSAGTVTPGLRRADSQVDMLFWVAAVAAAGLLHPGAVPAILAPVLVLLAGEVVCYAVGYVRFGRESATHALLSKMWGLALFAGLSEFILTGADGPLFWSMVVIGLVSQADVIAIQLLLPVWTHDVPSAWHAYRLRRGRPIRRHRLFN